MRDKAGKLNWKALFAGNPGNVWIAESADGRVIGTDRYSVWDLTRVCEAQGIDVPAQGRYKAMVRELRSVTDPWGDYVEGPRAESLRDTLNRYAGAIEPAPADRLVISEWTNGHCYPVIHTGTAEVRAIAAHWVDGFPRIGTGTYWMPCTNWERTNVAVLWDMHGQRLLGAVQLVGSATHSGSWGDAIGPILSKAFALEALPSSVELIEERYPSSKQV